MTADRNEQWGSARLKLARLAEHRTAFVLLLLAIKSLFHPYLGLMHDAKLYSVQVARHVWPETYSSDLFFAFGSQDSFTLFANLIAPIAGYLGVERSFFLIWLACTCLLLVAELHLVQRLLGCPLTVVATMILLAISEIVYAGVHVFHVHEPFLTARLPAEVAVIAGLACLLDRRFLSAATLLILGLLMHPIIAVGGLLVSIAMVVAARVGTTRLMWGVSIGAAILGAAILSPNIGDRLFSRMDDTWYHVTRAVSPHCFLTEWSWRDWARAACTLIVLVTGRRYLSAAARDLVTWTGYLAVAGMLVTAVAEWTRYTLLIQGQGYRALWLAELLAVPVGCHLLARLWHQSTVPSRALAIATLVYLLRPLASSEFFLPSRPDCLLLWFVLSVTVFCVLRMRVAGSGDGPLWSQATVIALAITSGCVSAGAFLSYLDFAAGVPAWKVVLWRFATLSVSPTVLFALAWLIVIVAARYIQPRALSMVAGPAWLLLAATPLVLNELPGTADPLRHDRDSVRFVQTHLSHANPKAAPPSIYWPTDPTSIWLDLRGTSYFSHYQVLGAVFSRDLCEVATRRAKIARSFEVDWMRQTELPRELWEMPLRLLETDLEEPPPSRHDLLRIAADPALDWIICRHRFGNLAEATDGSVYIYNAASLRAAYSLSFGSGVSASTSQTRLSEK